jgi:hypothetical protein
MPSDISYLRRFKAYVRRLWPSEVVSFTVVVRASSFSKEVEARAHAQDACYGVYSSSLHNSITLVQMFGSSTPLLYMDS